MSREKVPLEQVDRYTGKIPQTLVICSTGRVSLAVTIECSERVLSLREIASGTLEDMPSQLIVFYFSNLISYTSHPIR
jgi:hypothetical protein